jgi:hypothetical protein
MAIPVRPYPQSPALKVVSTEEADQTGGAQSLIQTKHEKDTKGCRPTFNGVLCNELTARSLRAELIVSPMI